MEKGLMMSNSDRIPLPVPKLRSNNDVTQTLENQKQGFQE